MVKQDAAHLPIQQVGRGGQGKRVADAAGIVGAMAIQDNAGQAPVALSLGVKADGELLGPAGEFDEVGGGIERGGLAAWRDAHNGRFLIGRLGLHAQHVHQLAGGRDDGVAFEPGAHVAAIPGAVAGQEVAACPVRGVEQVRAHGYREHARAVIDAPGNRRVAAFHGAPEASGVLDHWHRRAMVLAVAAQQSGRAVGRRGPCHAAIQRAADQEIAVVLIRPEQVKRATMDEQRGPKGAVYGRDFSPGGAVVARLKDVGHGAAVFGALGSKLVVGCDVIAVGQNSQAGRADVDARGGRAVVNDDARHD